jgi:hypothetical protein
LYRENLPTPHSFSSLTGRILPPNTHAHEKEGSDMRTYLMVLSLAMSIACSVAVLTPAFSEEYRGTLDQQMACTPDVWRLCSDQIPDVNRITACLRQNTPQLSGPCRSVFDSNASVPQPTVPQAQARRRQAPPPTYEVQPRTYYDVQPRAYPVPPRPDDDDQ